MKILRLDLSAVGPFTGVSVDLARGSEGFHLIYGRNEAGKSSALRALRQLFFGIPGQTADNFIHAYKDLRIGARLRDGKGAEQEFIRRKANTRALRGADDETVIEDAVLRRYLGSVDEGTFHIMFGINNATLVEGGKAIVEGGGDIGALLFAAGAGLADLRTIQQVLDKEATDLFLPRGTTKPINQALNELDGLRRTVREHTLPSSDWLAHEQALSTSLANKEAIARQLSENQRALHRLERIRDALPAIAKRQELLREMERHADAVQLPRNFGDQRRDILFALKDAERVQAEATADRAEMDQQMAELVVPVALLAAGEDIEHLHRSLGSHQKAVRDRSGLVMAHQHLETGAQTILRELGRGLDLDQAESLRLTAPQRRRIQDLGNERQVVAAALAEARARIDDIGARIDEANRERAGLAPARDPIPLQRSIRRVQQQGNLEDQWQTDRQNLLAAEKQAESDLRRLPIWSGSLQELEQLPIPAPETIDRLENGLDGLDDDLRTRRQKCETLERECLDLDRQLQQLELRQAVPTEEHLEDARRQRDAEWQLVRQAWQQPKASIHGPLPPAADLADAFEASLQTSDEIADRLRREADQVAAKARCQAERERCEGQLVSERRHLERIEGQLDSTRREWSALWQPLGIDPPSPKEMRAWVRKHDALLTQAQTIHSQRQRVAGLEQRIHQSRDELNQHLAALGEPAAGPQDTLSALVDRCLEVVERIKAVEARGQELNKRLATLEADRIQARTAAQQAADKLHHWQAEWSEAMTHLGLNNDASPSQANTVLDCLRDLFDRLAEAESHRQRIDGIDRDSRQFTAEVRTLTGRLAPDLDRCPVEQATVELNARLTHARAARGKLDALASRRLAAQEKLDRARATFKECQGRLEVMCREAHCATPEELAEAERRSTQRCDLEAQIKHVEQQLLGLSAGAPLATFLADAAAVDADALGEAIAQCKHQNDVLNNQKSLLDQAIGRAREILKTMDGSAKAAAAAEQVQFLLAKIGSDAECYARLRLASVILRHAIVRYREKNQGPVLKRASELFADLTVGSFEGLRVEVNDQGQPVLVGVRPGKKEIVPVQAGMSEGTRDQLYLALRLASLEVYLDKHEPMPFIIDDVLINFDDDRSAAALKALAQLSERTQVLFFTHHQHLVDLATTTLDDDVLFTHELRAKPAAKCVGT
jgi:uncharacterized protein YhaN